VSEHKCNYPVTHYAAPRPGHPVRVVSHCGKDAVLRADIAWETPAYLCLDHYRAIKHSMSTLDFRGMLLDHW
jgi:hypothetical protein